MICSLESIESFYVPLIILFSKGKNEGYVLLYSIGNWDGLLSFVHVFLSFFTSTKWHPNISHWIIRIKFNICTYLAHSSNLIFSPLYLPRVLFPPAWKQAQYFLMLLKFSTTLPSIHVPYFLGSQLFLKMTCSRLQLLSILRNLALRWHQ